MEEKGHVIGIGGCMDRRTVKIFALLDNEQMSLEEKIGEAAKLLKDTENKSFEAIVELIKRTYGKHVIVFTDAGASAKGMEKGVAEKKREYVFDEFLFLGHYSSGDHLDKGCGGKIVMSRMILDEANRSELVAATEMQKHFRIDQFIDALKRRGVSLSDFKALGEIDAKQLERQLKKERNEEAKKAKSSGDLGQVKLKSDEEIANEVKVAVETGKALGDMNRLELIGAVSKEIQLENAKMWAPVVAYYEIDTEKLNPAMFANEYRITGVDADIQIDIQIAIEVLHKVLNKDLIVRQPKVAGYSNAPKIRQKRVTRR
jgi:hypothetical protein